MSDNSYVCIDSRAFDNALAKRDDLINRYNDICEEYDSIIASLMSSWKGRGATAFYKDASTVKTNIVGIFDIVKTMCDTLADCREIFAECDSGLGEYNIGSKG